MKWVIQNNLCSSGARELANACKHLNIDHEFVEVVPFDPTLPAIEPGPAIFYGATNFVNNVWRSKKWTPSVFFNEKNFLFSSYLKNWNVLNSDAVITTFDKISRENIDPNKDIFIRPNKDIKEFAGEVIKFGDLVSWRDRISMGGFIFDGSCEIVISEPYNIADEWRLFVVNKEVITGSHYRTYGRLDVKYQIPESVLQFANKQIARWNPSPVYSLDIGKSGDGLYVIEANCFNSSGFYASDVEKLVKAVTDFASWV